MNIIHLVDYFQPKVGYQEYFLAKEQAKSSHDVRVLTSDRYYPFPDYYNTYQKLLGKRIVGTGERIEEGIKTVRLNTIEIPGTPLVYLNNLSAKINKFKPEVIYCHGVYSLTSYLAACYKSRFGYRLIFDSHASYFNTDFNRNLLKIIYHRIWETFFRPKIIQEADKIFVIGEEERRFLCDDFNLQSNKIPIIRLGVDTKLFTFSREDRKNIRKSLGLKEDIFLIVFAGKIIPGKKLELLIKAVGILLDEKIKILIIGGGDRNYVNTFKNPLQKNQIISIDFVENKNLSKFFSASDIGVWPGDPSQTMLEAMSCKVPLILPIDAETKYLDKSQGVLRFEPDDAVKLAEKIKILLYNQRIRQKLGENAHKYIKNRQSWKIIAKETLKLIK